MSVRVISRPVLDEEGIKLLGCAVIEHAVAVVRKSRLAYRRQRRSTAPLYGQAKADQLADVRRSLDEQRAEQAQEWIDGFALEHCLHVFGLNLNPDAIRRGAKLPAPALHRGNQITRYQQ